MEKKMNGMTTGIKNMNKIPAKIELTKPGDECPLCHQKVYKLNNSLVCACIEVDEDGNIF